MSLTQSLAFIAYCTLVTGAYPTTFPFENEVYQPAALTPATPDFSYDPESDPGGYVYYCANELKNTINPYKLPFYGTITDEMMPYITHHNGYSTYVLVNTFGAPPYIGDDTWNCTNKDIVFSESDYFGVFNGATICNAGECCSNLIGQVKFSDDQVNYHSIYGDKSQAGLCEDPFEGLYCILVGGDFQVNCYEYFISPDTRLAVFPCADSWGKYYLNCKVFKTGGYTWKDMKEPPMYQETLTPELNILTDGNGVFQDRVCNPYSYYFPTESTSSTSSASISTAKSTTDSSSDASSLFKPLFGLMLSVF